MGRLDLTNKRFTHLVALEPGPNRGVHTTWVCQCDCGNQHIVKTTDLTRGDTKSCGCLHITRRIGKRHGKLTITGYDEDNYWICKCDCGNTVTVRGDYLKDTSHCGCSFRKRKDPKKVIRRRIYGNYRNNAKNKGHEFELPRKLAYAMFEAPCFYCGSPPSRVKAHTHKGGKLAGLFIYNGIDRIDNTKGYVVGNVVPCCSQCNYMKGKMHGRDFILWARKVQHNTSFLELE